MGHITSIGRIGGLAVALGIGAALASTPGVAAASPNTLHSNSTQTNNQQNEAISTGGVVHVQKGNATAFSSGTGSVAIAKGFGSVASANGDHNHANADGSLAARSGGHSYIGASAADGAVVVDLRRLPGEVSYEAGSELATIVAGADLDTVQSALAAHRRSLPTGTCLTVGMSGLALGGGLGIDSRRYGLSCDMLTSATVVLPNGEVVTAAPGDHDDLYWALRGGGGGNFGVTTSMTFRTHAIEDRQVANLTFGGPDTAQAITGWHTWLTGSDRTVWSTVDVHASPTDEMRCTIGLAAPPGAEPRAAADLIAAIGLQPAHTESGTLTHMDLVRLMGGGDEWRRPRGFVAGSDVLAELTPTAAQSIATAIMAWPRTTGFAQVQIKPLDGAVADIAPDATAFPWRRHAVNLQWYAITPSSAVVNAANQWLTTAHQGVRPPSVGGYVNYLEPDTAAAWYFGANLGRLSSIRQKYDPAGVMYSGLNF